jgi:hypothetical protein
VARIRTIKPEFWTDEKLSILDPLTRLVFLGLISMADDAGRLVDSVRLVDGMLFPNTDDTSRDSLDTLARMSRIVRYRSSSGQALIQILNWDRHQKVDNPNKYTLPGPESAAVIQPAVSNGVNGASEHTSLEPRENLASLSRNPIVTTPDLRPTTNDLRPTTPERAGDWVDSLAAVWKNHRKGRAPRELIERSLGELHEEHGTDALIQAVTRFLKSTKAQYGVNFFATNFGDYLSDVPRVSPNGLQTKADRLRTQAAALRGVS